MNQLTEVVFILDRSGSMYGLEQDTIGGFNSMLEKQKKETGEALISTILFDNHSKVLHNRISISKVKPMTNQQYCVGGSTALLDALGGAIHHIGSLHKNAPKSMVPDKTIFIIITDGMENASEKYTYRAVQKMVERQQKRFGWEFLFLAANIDAAQTAGSMGIEQNHAVNYLSDAAGTRNNYDAVSKAISSVRTYGSVDSSDWREDIERDYQTRSQRH